MSIGARMDALVVAELARLEALGFDEVAVLPPLASSVVDTPDGRIKVDRFHRSPSPSEHLVAIVAWRPGARGVWDEPQVEGFVLGANGSRRGLSESEAWQFQ